METRADLRTSLQRKTDGRLTDSDDQDYYLDLGELELLPMWYDFDPDLFSQVRQSISSDSSGIILLPTSWLETLRLEDANGSRIEQIPVDSHLHATGYFNVGYDVASDKRKIQVVQNGAAWASASFYFFSRERTTTGSGDAATPIFPLEFRDLIAHRGAQLYFEDQGPSFDDAAEVRRIRFERRLNDARRIYERPNKSPQFAQTFDADARNASQRVIGTLGYR